MLTRLRVRNLKVWKDSGEFRLAPLTVLFEANSAGKTSIPQLLLLLKQTAESPDRQRALQFGDSRTLIDLGTYDDAVHARDVTQPLDIDLRWTLDETLEVLDPLSQTRYAGDSISFRVSIAADKRHQPIIRFLEYLLHRDASRRHALVDALSLDLMLFGEWCYAVHTVRYTKLPDWFLAFDVYDRPTKSFWSVARRDEFAQRLGLEVVPRLASGRFGLADLVGLLGQSKLSTGPAEGLYVRREEGDRLVARAKLVRSEFVQNIDTHWSRGPLRTNLLAPEGGAVNRSLGTGARWR